MAAAAAAGAAAAGGEDAWPLKAVVSEPVKKAVAGHAEVASALVRGTLSEWECPVCTEIALRPAMTACGHFFHKRCIDSWLADHDTCPVCMSALVPGPGRWQELPGYVRNMLDRTQVRCPQQCGQEVQFDLLESHITRAGSASGCPRTVFTCSSTGCKWRGPRVKAAEHLEKCTHRVVACGQCAELRKRKMMQQHSKAECIRRRVKCESCGEGVPLHSMVDHLRDDCTGPVERRELTRAQRLLEQRNMELGERDRQIAALKTAVRLAAEPPVQAYTVTSAERPLLDGKYKRVIGERNGCPVWENARRQLRKGDDGCWEIASDTVRYVLSDTPGSRAGIRPVIGEVWKTADGAPAPGTAIGPAAPGTFFFGYFSR